MLARSGLPTRLNFGASLNWGFTEVLISSRKCYISIDKGETKLVHDDYWLDACYFAVLLAVRVAVMIRRPKHFLVCRSFSSCSNGSNFLVFLSTTSSSKFGIFVNGTNWDGLSTILRCLCLSPDWTAQSLRRFFPVQKCVIGRDLFTRKRRWLIHVRLRIRYVEVP